MLHLLPDTQKKRVIKEYRMRIAIVIAIFIALISVAGTALLLPTYLSAVGSLNTVKNGNKIKQNSIDGIKGNNLDEKIKNVDYGLQALKISQEIPNPNEVYNTLMDGLQSGVVINRYSYMLVDNKSASISIDGVAGDRDTLVYFQNKLKAHEEFQGIEIPISSFAKKNNINFSIKFNLIKIDKK